MNIGDWWGYIEEKSGYTPDLLGCKKRGKEGTREINLLVFFII